MHLRGKCNSGSNICSDMGTHITPTGGMASICLGPIFALAVAAATLSLALAPYPVAAQQRPSESAVPATNQQPQGVSAFASTTDAPVPVVFRNYEPVTAERLKNPEPANWLQIRGTYAGWGYSELDQITPKNVNKLQLAWVFSTGAISAHEAAPLVNNGVMYVSAPGNQVFAINGYGQEGVVLQFPKLVKLGATLSDRQRTGVWWRYGRPDVSCPRRFDGAVVVADANEFGRYGTAVDIHGGW